MYIHYISILAYYYSSYVKSNLFSGNSDLSFAALARNNGNQVLHNVGNSLYSEMSLTNDQYSRSTAAAKDGTAYEIPMPLLMLDDGTDERP